MILVLQKACRDAHDGRVGYSLRCAVASGSSPKGVSRGAGGSCLAACRASRAVPLRREVPRRACPEAQEGRAWLTVKYSRCVVASGGSPNGLSRGAGDLSFVRLLCIV